MIRETGRPIPKRFGLILPLVARIALFAILPVLQASAIEVDDSDRFYVTALNQTSVTDSNHAATKYIEYDWPLFAPALNYAVGDGPWSVFCADLDGDLDLDLAVADFLSDTLSILKNNGDGTFQPNVDYSAGDALISVFCADLDVDGDLDLAVANASGDNVSILKNNGNGTFQTAVNYGAGDTPTSVFCADLDVDGDLDLAVANASSDNVSILKNNGNGTFQTAVNYGAGDIPASVFCADLDGDLDLDLAVANGGSNNVSILINNGDGTFGPKVDYAATDAVSVSCADLDGDTDLDLAVANQNSHSVSILKNNGDGSFQSKVDYGAGTYPQSVFCADLDGDLDLDLAVANLGSDSVSILMNNGDGTFEPKIDYAAGDGPRSVFCADLDGDSDLDLTVANYNSDNVSILMNLIRCSPVISDFSYDFALGGDLICVGVANVGDVVLFVADLSGNICPISTVTVDLFTNGLGGSAYTALYDDGTHGDAVAGDLHYSLEWVIREPDPLWVWDSEFDGLHYCTVTAVGTPNDTSKGVAYIGKAVDTEMPYPVYELSGQALSGARIRLCWRDATDANDKGLYYIYWNNGSGGTGGIDTTFQYAHVTAPESCWTSDPLTNDLNYCFLIRNVDDACNMEYNYYNLICITADAEPPTAGFVQPGNGDIFGPQVVPIQFIVGSPDADIDFFKIWYRQKDEDPSTPGDQPGPWIFGTVLDNDEQYGTWDWDPTGTLPDGAWELVVCGRDQAGNEQTPDDAHALGQTVWIIWDSTLDLTPVVSDIPDQTVDEGSSFTPINLDDYVTDVDDSDSEMVWSYSGNVELSVDITDRVATISVPHADWSGSETITFRATDPDGLHDEDVATFTVTAVNDTPVVWDIPDQTIDEGSSFTPINLDDYVTDVDNSDSEMVWSYSGNVELSVDMTDRVATISVLHADWNGSEAITFTATDPGGLSDGDEARFTVTAEPQSAPVLDSIGPWSLSSDDTLEFSLKETHSLEFVLYAHDPERDSLFFFADSLPEGASFDSVTGNFRWTPYYGDVGEYLVLFVVSDGRLSDSAYVKITVKNRLLGVIEHYPYSDEEDVLIDACINVSFSEPIKFETVDSSCFAVQSKKDGILRGACIYGQDNYSLGFCLGSGLMFSTLDTVKVTLTTGIKDLADSGMAEDYSWEFYTGIGVYPGNTNNDNIVDERDILPLGFCWGESGPSRSAADQNLTWSIKPVHRWTADSSWDPESAVYADADGNGIVDEWDICGVSDNWDSTVSGPLHKLQKGIDLAKEGVREYLSIYEKIYNALLDCPESEGKSKIKKFLEGILEKKNLPQRFEVSQNYPNPFNFTTVIRYSLPEDCQVEITLFNILGQKVKTLVSEYQTSGYKKASWDGKDDWGEEVGSGIYLYQVKTEGFSCTRKLLFLK